MRPQAAKREDAASSPQMLPTILKRSLLINSTNSSSRPVHLARGGRNDDFRFSGPNQGDRAIDAQCAYDATIAKPPADF
jgi:hypothetical protein